MSKSVGNVINLSDDSQAIKKKVMGMYTDPSRIHGTEPGNVEENPVFVYLDAFASETGDKQHVTRTEQYKERYRKGTVGDIEVKEFLFEVLEGFLQPLRKKRAEFEEKAELVDQILKEGTERARTEAQRTLADVRMVMKIDY